MSIEDDYCENCYWYEETFDAPCYICKKPNYEKCPHENKKDKENN